MNSCLKRIAPRAYLKAHFTLERLHRRMYVRVLFQPRWRGESLPAIGTGVRPGAHVVLPDVPLQITGISEYLQIVRSNNRFFFYRCISLPSCSFRSGTSCAPRALHSGALWDRACRSTPWGSSRSGTHPSCGCAWRSSARPIYTYTHKTHYFKQRS